MATLSKKKNGTFEIQFRDGCGYRKTLYLGQRYTERTATELKGVVEKLLVCQSNSTDLDRRSTVWLETASVEIREKLPGVGLIVVPPSHTLKELWDTFLAYKARHVKESTMTLYGAVRSRFDLFFDKSEPVDELTKERMQAWKDHMLEEIAEASVASYTVAR